MSKRHVVHRIIHHGTDFAILLVLFVLGFGSLLFFQHQVDKQILTVGIMSVLYALWGALHHYHEGDLTMEIILEYIAVATMIAFILIILILRA